MATFAIDSENDIVAHAGTPASVDNQQPFSTEKELAKLAAEWPAARLIEVWNSFAGVAPFDDRHPDVERVRNTQVGSRHRWRSSK